MKAQSEICAAFLGRTRATKNRPDQPLQPASARKRSRKVEEPKPPEDLVFQQQSAAASGVDGGGDERQQSPVHGISLKLQEEEREHRMDFVPEVSAINTDHIEVDKETLDMLHFLEINDLSNITQVDPFPVQQTFPFTQNMLLCSDFNDDSEQSVVISTQAFGEPSLDSYLSRWERPSHLSTPWNIPYY